MKVYQFMGSALGLSGVELLVFARIFGFTLSGLQFYESRAKTAEFFGCTRRAVITAVGKLVEKGLIVEVSSGRSDLSGGNKEYTADLDRVSKLAGLGVSAICPKHPFVPSEGTSLLDSPGSEEISPGTDEHPSPLRVKDVHPIPKGKEK